VDISEARLVGGFAQARTVRAKDLLYQGPWAELAEAEADIIAHMNDEHREALGLIGRSQHRGRAKNFSMIGIDPEGCDLRVGGQRVRIPFEGPLGPVANPTDARRVLVALTHNARENRGSTVVSQRGRD
jgi:putative heme iron utilization protein